MAMPPEVDGPGFVFLQHFSRLSGATLKRPLEGVSPETKTSNKDLQRRFMLRLRA
jgi:hypothetical protein